MSHPDPGKPLVPGTKVDRSIARATVTHNNVLVRSNIGSSTLAQSICFQLGSACRCRHLAIHGSRKFAVTA